jgi:phage shock protein PspC (stress-responsive transcriptional regulator)
MTENETGYAPPPPGFTPPPAPPPAPPRSPLRRTTGDANVLGGVAAGIARSLGIDPILVRVAFVVLTVFGGSGVLLYLVGWLFIPEDGRSQSAGERFFRDNNALAIAAAVVVGVLVVGPMLAWGLWGDGPGFGGLLLLFLVIAAVVALTRRGNDGADVPVSTLPPASTVPATDGTQATQVLATPAVGSQLPPPPVSTTGLPPVPPPPPPAPRERSVLGRLTVGVTLLVAGTLIALDVANVISIGAVTVLASALAVVAVGLLVGAYVGRSRGLIALGVVLVLALIPLGALPDDIRWNAGAGAGDRVYRVTSQEDLQAEYRLGVGELTLDLRRLDLTEPAEVDVSLGVGELIVVLPDDVPVSATADVAVGVIELPGERAVDGVGVSSSWDRSADDLVTAGALDLTLSTGFGQVTVIDDSLEVSP